MAWAAGARVAGATWVGLNDDPALSRNGFSHPGGLGLAGPGATDATECGSGIASLSAEGRDACGLAGGEGVLMIGHTFRIQHVHER